MRLIRSALARASWASAQPLLRSLARLEGRTFHQLRSPSQRASGASRPAWLLPLLDHLVGRTLHLRPSERPAASGEDRSAPPLHPASRRVSFEDSRVVVPVEDRFHRSLTCPWALGLLGDGCRNTARRANPPQIRRVVSVCFEAWGPLSGPGDGAAGSPCEILAFLLSSCSSFAWLLRLATASLQGLRRRTEATCCLWAGSSAVCVQRRVAFSS